MVEDGSAAATSRTYGVAAQQIFDNPVGLLPTGSYNAELVVPLSAEMRARLAIRRGSAPSSVCPASRGHHPGEAMMMTALTAVNVLLKPDVATRERAKALNALLRGDLPRASRLTRRTSRTSPCSRATSVAPT